jgi:predicted dienelactone hydrolase
MRPLEISLILLIAAAAFYRLRQRRPLTGVLLMASSLLVLIAHVVFEGAHWQMIPAYAAYGVLFVTAWKKDEGQGRFKRMTPWPALLLAAASVLFSLVLPMFRLPAPTGPYPVGTSILYLKDSSRIEDASPSGGSARELMVQLWYPAQPSHNRLARYREPRETEALSSYQSAILTHSRFDAPVALAGAPFPVVLFNHGWGGRRTNDTFLTEELASHGYVVASIDHTYNARLVEMPDGRIVHGTGANEINDPDSSTAERVKAIWNKELTKWVADQRFVLDRLEAMNRASVSPWTGRLDTKTSGAIGHSFGGAAATALCAEDPRVHAAVNMDGWFFDAIHKRAENQQLLVIDAATNQESVTTGPNATVEEVLDATDSADTEASLRRFGGYLVTVKGTEHDDFTDQPRISPLRAISHRGAVSADRIEAIVRSYVVAFFGKTLRGEKGGVLDAPTSPFAETSVETWPANNERAMASTRF